jgi:hypothetical protein
MGKRTKVFVLYGSYRNTIPPPGAIDLSDGLSDTFGKKEVEQEACHLMEFFQMKGEWGFFDLDSLKQFYKDRGYRTDRMLYGLICPWFDEGKPLVTTIHIPGPYILMLSDGRLMATNHFLNRLKKHVVKVVEERARKSA